MLFRFLLRLLIQLLGLSTMALSSVTVTLTSSSDGEAAVVLYAHDQLLADAAATVVARETVSVIAQESKTITMSFDRNNIEQAGKKWDEMAEPGLYVALNVAESTLTYDGSPVFGLQPGDTAELKLKAKAQAS